MAAIKTKKHVTEEQKAYLVEFIEKHPQLKSGKFTAQFTFQKARELWMHYTDEINQIVGPQKDWKSWRKCWQDARSKAKKKKSFINKHRNATGGGKPTSDELTSIEERIVDLQSVIAVEGHQDTQESLVEFESLENPENTQPLDIQNMDMVLVDHNIHVLETGLLEPASNGGSQQLPPPQPTPQAIQEFKGKRRFATSRLSLSVLETQNLNDQMSSKLTMKQKYFNDKLAIEERNLAATTAYHEAKLEKLDMIISLLKCIADKQQ